MSILAPFNIAINQPGNINIEKSVVSADDFSTKLEIYKGLLKTTVYAARVYGGCLKFHAQIECIDDYVVFQSLLAKAVDAGKEIQKLTLTKEQRLEYERVVTNGKAAIDQGVKDPATATPIDIDAKTTLSSDNVYNLLAPIGIGDKALTQVTSVGGTCPSDPNATNGLGCYLNIIFLLAIGLCGVLAVIMIIIHSIRYMGDESVFGKTEAKSKIMSAILGLLIALGAYALLRTINPALTGENGVNVSQVSYTLEDKLALSFAGVDYTSTDGKAPSPDDLKKIRTQYGKNWDSVKSVYIPALNRALPNIPKGAKTLLTAQTSIEGFYPGTKSWSTNNPGNIGNVDTGGIVKYATLEDGIKKQYDYISGIISGNNKYYKIGAHVTRPAVTYNGVSYPGIDFTYDGSLYQYLQIYSTGARKSNAYLNYVVSFFQKEGYTIDGHTKVSAMFSMR